METASCSILSTLRLSSTASNNSNNTYCYCYTPRNPHLVLPFSSIFPRNSTTSPGKCLHFNRFIAFSSPSSSDNKNPSQELAVLLEVEGVLMDAYRVGNRQAFNVAFQKLGLDCANWKEPVYLDLVRKCSGDEERMLNLYFNRIGWPTSLPTNEKGPFIKSVLREKKNALDEFVMSKNLPLRPGVEEGILLGRKRLVRGRLCRRLFLAFIGFAEMLLKEGPAQRITTGVFRYDRVAST
ncbi:hypothetical protein SLA2020_368300 [Shorea laevis]